MNTFEKEIRSIGAERHISGTLKSEMVSVSKYNKQLYQWQIVSNDILFSNFGYR